MADIEKLTRAMAEFESGEVDDNPFELFELDPEALRGMERALDAFASAAAEDVGEHTDDPRPDMYVHPGLLHGLWIGYRYTQLEHSRNGAA